MRVPLRWLSEYVDVTIEPEELARRLTVASVEVGEIVTTGADWDGIRVGLVEEVKPHPNADRLVLATVLAGEGERHTVVCGAPNVAAGQKIAFAQVGARLIDGHTGRPTVLKRAKIRGVESAGMICSEKELGLSEEHEGILVLPEDAPVGASLRSVLGDVIFELEVTPNRPDLLSIVGVAREVAALTRTQVRDPSLQYKESGQPVKERASVEIRDPDLCPRYVAALIENVKVRPSPPWLQERLIAAGMRPINNVVDVTNYVMLELGQPLHAFDFKKLRGKKIVVRRAAEGEKLTLIDGSVRDLSPEMLVIADEEAPVAVAGVMGGIDSEVTEKTTTVLLESANFNPASIRRASQALKMRTDASIRFEKGLSRRLPVVAAQRAVKLIVEVCGARAAPGLIDQAPGKEKDIRITLTQERLRRVLGIDLPRNQVREVLEALGFGCRWVPPDRFVVRVPYWRTDVSIPDDVVEEVARIVGYDELPTRRLRGEIPVGSPEPRLQLRERLRDALAAAGMQEVINYSLTRREALERVVAPEDLASCPPIRVANPMSREHEFLRTTLRHSLLESLSRNARTARGLLALFEIGRRYLPRADDLPEEVETVCAAVSGRKPDRWGQPTGDPAGFFDAKARLDHLLGTLHVSARYEDTVEFAYLPGRTAAVIVDGRQIGILGEVHPRVLRAFDVGAQVAMFELDLEALAPHVREAVHYEPVSPYPALEQDLAIILPESIPAARAAELVRSSPLVRRVSIFDVYTGPPIPKGRKSIAFSVSFQSPTRTLKDEDVRRERERIVARLREELGAELRG